MGPRGLGHRYFVYSRNLGYPGTRFDPVWDRPNPDPRNIGVLTALSLHNRRSEHLTPTPAAQPQLTPRSLCAPMVPLIPA
eukprot:1312041-Prymnesium_polylepis.1